MGHEKRQNLATSSLFSRDKGPIKTQPVSMAPRGCVCPRYRRFSLRHRLTRVSGALSCKNPRRYASDALVHASVLDQVATNLESSGVSGPLGCVSPHCRRLSLLNRFTRVSRAPFWTTGLEPLPSLATSGALSSSKWPMIHTRGPFGSVSLHYRPLSLVDQHPRVSRARSARHAPQTL